MILKPIPVASKQMKLFQLAFLAVAAILTLDSIYWAVFVIAHFFAPEWEKTLGRHSLIASVKGLTLLCAGVFGVLLWKTYRRLFEDIRALKRSEQELRQQEQALRSSEAYLAEGQRLSHTGSFGWNVLSGEIRWSEETYNIFEQDRAGNPTVEMILQR